MNEKELREQARRMVEALGWGEDGRPTDYLLRAFGDGLLGETQLERLQAWFNLHPDELVRVGVDEEVEVPQEWLDRAVEIETEVLLPPNPERDLANPPAYFEVALRPLERRDQAFAARNDGATAVPPAKEVMSPAQIIGKFDDARPQMPEPTDAEWLEARMLFCALVTWGRMADVSDLSRRWSRLWGELEDKYGLSTGPTDELWTAVWNERKEMR